MTTSKFFGGVRGFAIAGISGRVSFGFTLLLLFILTSGVWSQEDGRDRAQPASREDEAAARESEEVGRVDSDDLSGPREAVFVRGDANSDGSVNMADGMSILGYIFLGAEAPQCLDAADADDNGELAITDSLRLFGYLFNGGSAPAAPSPTSLSYDERECNDDPTDDLLGCETPSRVCVSESTDDRGNGTWSIAELWAEGAGNDNGVQVSLRTVIWVSFWVNAGKEDKTFKVCYEKVDQSGSICSNAEILLWQDENAPGGIATNEPGLISHQTFSQQWASNGAPILTHQIWTLRLIGLDCGQEYRVRAKRVGGVRFPRAYAETSACSAPPVPGILTGQPSVVLSHDSGLFAVNDLGELERSYWDSNTWQQETIPHWGADLVPGSLVQGEAGEKIYGVNTAGQVFTTWSDNGVIGFALIDPPGGVSVDSDSLVMSHDSGLFAVGTNGVLERFYWDSNTWQQETIPHWGADLVPGSLVRGEAGEKIYGVNTAGQVFTTWSDNGVIGFALIDPPGGVSVNPASLVMSHDSGLFAVGTNGALQRFYWGSSNGWQRQIIPHWGANLVPLSLVRGEAGEKIYGVNTAGQVFTTWSDNGVISFALIDPPGVSIRPDSLVMSHDSGLFAVGTNGALERFYWASNTWQRQSIPHWGANLVPWSLIRGEAGEKIYGVNTDGQIFTTWSNNGVISFALIP